MTAQRPRWRAALAVTSVLLAATACGNAGGSKDATAPVKIGLVAALSGVSDSDAEHLAAAFGIKTVRDLGSNKHFAVAGVLVALSRHSG